MLEIKGLTCGYNSKIIFQEVDLKVKDKEFIGVIGPNGAGKTTLLRAISRVVKPHKGAIFWEEKDIWRWSLKELARNIAVVSQSYETRFITVEEFVLLGRIPHYKKFQFLETARDLEIARRCMWLTDTLELKDRPLEKLSGGEKQLTLIARALAQEPRLLLLDEPTVHLDIKHTTKILVLIKKLNSELGLTVIIILHDLNLASEYCNRLILIDQGRIRKIGFPREVLTEQIIEEVYKTAVVIRENPKSSKPYIFVST